MEKKFNVITWNINTNKLEAYDVLPYFRREYDKAKDKPTTKEEWKEFVKKEGMYQFWARCEYEVIISPWPVMDKQVKIDVWYQIENNIDIIVDILMAEH